MKASHCRSGSNSDSDCVQGADAAAEVSQYIASAGGEIFSLKISSRSDRSQLVCGDCLIYPGSSGEVPTGTQSVVTKLLVANPIAGSIIGKVYNAALHVNLGAVFTDLSAAPRAVGSEYRATAAVQRRQDSVVSGWGVLPRCAFYPMHSMRMEHVLTSLLYRTDRYLGSGAPPIWLTALGADLHLPHPGEDLARQQHRRGAVAIVP